MTFLVPKSGQLFLKVPQFLVLFLCKGSCTYTSDTPDYKHGDGYCDEALNIPECEYDRGDCCGPNFTDWPDDADAMKYCYGSGCKCKQKAKRKKSMYAYFF